MAISGETAAALGWPRVVEAWAQRCSTDAGQAAVLDGSFFDTREQANAHLLEVGQILALGARKAWLPFGGIAEIGALLTRVRKAAALDAPELRVVAQAAKGMAALRKHLHHHREEATALAPYASELPDLGHLYHPILEAFGPDGRLVDHASERLGPLRRQLQQLKAQIERRMRELLEDPRFSPFLQDSYYTQREERYVLPVRSDGKGFVKGIVHGSSQSGQTFFVEPEEMVELNNKVTWAESDIADEERRIYAQFSTWIAEEADALARGSAAATALDVRQAAARLAEELVASPPELVAEPRLHLLHARHPLMLLAGRRCVANDIVVGRGQALVISGPNAGGKSVALKTAGLCALMARAGLFLPAEAGSQLGWFEEVRSEIGDAQNLEHNLSTFSGHLLHMKEALTTAGPGTLLLIDEIAVGTDPEQGACVAQALLEALVSAGATVMVTTHYERLKLLASDDARFVNASVGFDFDQLLPTFKLHLGVPGSSGALTLMRTLEVSDAATRRAKELLGTSRVRIEDLLQNVTAQREKLEQERAQLLMQLHELQKQRSVIHSDRKLVRERFERQQRNAHGDAVAALRSARSELQEVSSALRKKGVEAKPEEVAAAKRKVVEAVGTLAKHEPKQPLPPGVPLAANQVEVGMPVLVPKLGARGEIAALPQRGEVVVRLGAMQAVMPVSDVLLDSHRWASAKGSAAKRTSGAAKGARAGSSVRRGASGGGGHGEDAHREGSVVEVGGGAAVAAGGRAHARTPDATLDVRGERADDAVAMLHKFLDDSLLAEREVVFILHGVGSGALRNVLRGELKRHGSVASFRPGEPSEGGDGMTLAWLK